MVRVPGADNLERRNFVRHYLEMVVAMFAGMAVGGFAVSMFCSLTGHQGLFDHPGASAPIMATNMTLGMAVWMRYRGHAWRPIGEMAASCLIDVASAGPICGLVTHCVAYLL